MSAIAQLLCTEKIEPYTNHPDGTNSLISSFDNLYYGFRGITGSTRGTYSY